MARVGVFLVTAALIAGMGGAYYVGGGNTPLTQNLEIRTWYDLDAIRDNLSGNHTLMNDLDSTTPGYEELASPTANQGKGWEPIGFLGYLTPEAGCVGVPVPAEWWFGLTGTFDGQGYEIRDLFINRPDECYVVSPMGLFGSINEGGIIKNVGVVNVTVTGCDTVGGLVGDNYQGTVSNSYSSGNITGDVVAGGLVGENRYGTVSNSYSTGNVTGNSSVGGLVGSNWYGIVSNCYATGNVTGERGSVGGLVGVAWHSTVSNCYATGRVTGENRVGGLVGSNRYESTVSNSFWDILTSGHTISDGGKGKTTAQMKNIATFSGATWDIIAVAPGSTNTTYIWNIVNGMTYPFLSWQP